MCLHVPSKMGQLYCDSPRRQGIIHLSANKTNLQSSFLQDHGVKALNTTLHSGHDALALHKLGIRLFCPHRNYYQCYTMLRESTEKFVSCTLEILTVMFKEMVVWAPFLKSNEKNLISKEHLMCSLFNRSSAFRPRRGCSWGGDRGPFSFADLPGLTVSLTAAGLPQYSSLLPHVAIRQLNVAGVNGDML